MVIHLWITYPSCCHNWIRVLWHPADHDSSNCHALSWEEHQPFSTSPDCCVISFNWQCWNLAKIREKMMKGENAGDKKHRYSATHQSTNRIKLFEEKCYILAFVVNWWCGLNFIKFQNGQKPLSNILQMLHNAYYIFAEDNCFKHDYMF